MCKTYELTQEEFGPENVEVLTKLYQDYKKVSSIKYEDFVKDIFNLKNTISRAEFEIDGVIWFIPLD